MNKQTGWCWRDGELSMKEFYKLNGTSRNQYVEMIEKLPESERSSLDKIILNQYSKNTIPVKKFISLDIN